MNPKSMVKIGDIPAEYYKPHELLTFVDSVVNYKLLKNEQNKRNFSIVSINGNNNNNNNNNNNGNNVEKKEKEQPVDKLFVNYDTNNNLSVYASVTHDKYKNYFNGTDFISAFKLLDYSRRPSDLKTSKSALKQTLPMTPNIKSIKSPKKSTFLSVKNPLQAKASSVSPNAKQSTGSWGSIVKSGH